MADAQFRVRLPICAEVLRRALYIHRLANKYRHVAADHHSSLRDLSMTALEIVTDATTVADEFLDALRLITKDIAAHGWADMGWAEISVRNLSEAEAFLFEENLWDALQFHMPIVSDIASHLKPVFEHVFRTFAVSAK